MKVIALNGWTHIIFYKKSGIKLRTKNIVSKKYSVQTKNSEKMQKKPEKMRKKPKQLPLHIDSV